VLTHALALFQFANRPEAALGIMAEGARHLGAGGRDVLIAEEAGYRLQMGQVARADAMATPLMDSAASPRAAAEAASVVAPARALQGRIAESMAAAERGLAMARSLSDELVDAGQHLFHILTALIDDGQVARAEQLGTAAWGDSTGRPDRFTAAFLALALGRTHRLRGRPETAARWFREAVAAFEAVRRLGFAAWSFAGLSAARAELGDADGARAAAARCRAMRDHPIRVAAAEVRRSLAWVHVADGDLDAAAHHFDEAAEGGLANRELVHAGHALHDLVRIGRPELAIDRLVKLTATTDSRILGVYADHAAAAADGDRARLASAAAAFEALGCELAAAEAWSQASRPGPDGRTDRAGAAAARSAAALAGRCERARTPLLATRAATADDLSDREREVAGLAATGMVRRQIAERLVISPRTVDSHLQRIYRKLGVSGREDLALLLHEPGRR